MCCYFFGQLSVICFTFLGTQQPLLPIATSSPPDDFISCSNPPCFLAGDARANEQPGLTAMHILWVREHNRLAELVKLPACQFEDTNEDLHDSGAIFQTARHIVVAEMQKITYKDYLPILLGQEFNDKVIGKYTGYNSRLSPNIPNSFASAAYRFGHSQVQPSFERLDPEYNSVPEGPLQLENAFFDISYILEKGIDYLMRGLITQPARAVDEFLNSILTNHLFASNPGETGFDLAALNIMRGRDHGIPTYLTWKNWAEENCEVECIEFRDPVTKTMLFDIYGGIQNVDLWVGGLAEKPLPEGIVGPTLGCIIAKTFKNLRDADRFFYENREVFTNNQIKEIEKTTLARVICDNTEADLKEVPKNVFKITHHDDFVSCDKLRDETAMDTKPWNCRKFLPPLDKDANGGRSGSRNMNTVLSLLQSIMRELSGEVAEEAGHRRMRHRRPPPATTEPPVLSDEEVMEKLEDLLEQQSIMRELNGEVAEEAGRRHMRHRRPPPATTEPPVLSDEEVIEKLEDLLEKME